MCSLSPFWIALINHSINMERSNEVSINITLKLLRKVRIKHTHFIYIVKQNNKVITKSNMSGKGSKLFILYLSRSILRGRLITF